jgi:nitrogen fixation protein FixH
MKFNWGTGVVIFLLIFLAAVITFVVFAFYQDVNMVHRDYYEKGVDHTATMEKEKRSAAYSSLIRIEAAGDSVAIIFPAEIAATVLSGEVLFFRPSDHNKDTSYPLGLKGPTMMVSRENLIPGRYIVKLTWTSAGLEYEVDKNVILP